MSEHVWTAVDDYLDSLHPPDEMLDRVQERASATNLPEISVSAQQGRLLTVLALAVQARTILEMGTLGGYSSVCLARALPEDGRLITLEADPIHAQVARENIAAAELSDRVTVVVGSALETLPEVDAAAPDGFDLVFIDADKEAYPDYWHWALQLAHPGTLIVADNVVRDGAIVDPDNREARVEGVREYLKLAEAEPTVLASTIQTVGSKGYDGLSISIVFSASV
jgi:predicted O-methyltransferase YrrM